MIEKLLLALSALLFITNNAVVDPNCIPPVISSGSLNGTFYSGLETLKKEEMTAYMRASNVLVCNDPKNMYLQGI